MLENAGNSPNSGNIGMVRGFAMRVANFVERARMAGALGQGFNGKRDLYESFGYPRLIDSNAIWEMYNRGGVARRIVTALPEGVWGRPPELYIQDNDAWNARWTAFAKKTDLWQACYRLDVMVNLGRYGVMLIGTDKGNLETPLRNASDVTFFQPYAEKDVKIQRWDTNPNSPTFGQPLEYMIYPVQQGSKRVTDAVAGGIMPTSSFKVHASRILHVCRDPLENKIFGIPIYAPIWNYLLDLMKVVGSSAEGFWKQAYPGLHADVDKEMDLEPGDEANLTAEIDEYEHQLRRFIRTRGVKVQAIGGQVADPKGAFDVLVTLIAGTTGLPKRVLLGSEAGQLASTQDKGNWAEQVEGSRALHAEPNIIRPLLLWLDAHKIIPTPDLTQVQILWPDAYRMSPLERAQQSAQVARTLANIQKGLQPIVIKPGKPATPDTTAPDGAVIPGTPGTEDETAEPILTRDEARRLLGLSTDQNLLDSTPT